MTEALATGLPPGRRWLLLSLFLLILAVWTEPSGSWLAEPDEARYAEIPREMLATGDFVVPRLNGIPYFEKPPLLYWANAGSFALFGETPFAARFPTRLAGMGTLLLVLFGVGRLWGRRAGLLAAVLFLVSPLGFTFCRLNLTDGILTFFFTATVFAGFETIRAATDGRRGRARALSALTGALAAGAFLSKGLVGIVLPGGILFFWALATRQARSLLPLLLGPAGPVLVALAAPWAWLAEKRSPGFLQFFFIHEHFQRFATPVASRPGPVYYFVLVFIGGFLPALAFFARGVRPVGRDHPNALFFLIWFGVVLVFFSLSHSKLTPYLFPAFPPAAALAARGLMNAGAARRKGAFVFAALASALLPIAALAIPDSQAALSAGGAWGVALAGTAVLAAAAIAGLRFAFASDSEKALGCLGAGWAAFYLALALIWPRTDLARDNRELALAAKSTSESAPSARIVSYRTYLQTFPWTLREVVPAADFTGELESWWLPEEKRREILWTNEEFRRRWSSGERLVVLLRNADAGDFAAATPRPRVVLARRKYRVVANFGEASP